MSAAVTTKMALQRLQKWSFDVDLKQFISFPALKAIKSFLNITILWILQLWIRFISLVSISSYVKKQYFAWLNVNAGEYQGYLCRIWNTWTWIVTINCAWVSVNCRLCNRNYGVGFCFCYTMKLTEAAHTVQLWSPEDAVSDSALDVVLFVALYIAKGRNGFGCWLLVNFKLILLWNTKKSCT